MKMEKKLVLTLDELPARKERLTSDQIENVFGGCVGYRGMCFAYKDCCEKTSSGRTMTCVYDYNVTTLYGLCLF